MPNSPPTNAWATGALVGRYMLLAPIAQGGMAEIWLARQSGMKGFEKLLVIKRMTNTLEADPEHIEMFLSEARLAAQLNHPNVVQIYELGEHHGSYYIAMEYLDGENLSVLRRTGLQLGKPLPDALAARIVGAGAEGLHYAHTRMGLDGKPLSIVHRDVSPQNIIVSYDGGVKVVDFGIAKASSHATMSGKLKGKLAYMSPEQARGEPLDARSDVYALGIVLFELVTRTRLLPKMEDLEVLRFMSGTDPLPRAGERRHDIPAGLEPIISKAMSRKREQRFQSARELQMALEHFLRSIVGGSSSADLAEYMRGLFADRMQERRTVIEAAMTQEMTPNAARAMQGLAPTLDAGSGSVGFSQETAMPGRRMPLPLLVGAGVLLALGMVAIIAVASRTPAPEPVVIQQQAPQEAPEAPVLTIVTEPAGAAIEVDGKPMGQSPLVLDKLSLGDHKVVATLEGYLPLTRLVNLARSGEKTQMLLPLQQVGKEPPAKDPTVVKQPVAVAAKGRLTLKTEPWTQVFLGKTKLGDTPLINQPLPAGKLVLRLVNPESGLESSIEVEIKPNETTVKKLKL